jgi:hypothetical protein
LVPVNLVVSDRVAAIARGHPTDTQTVHALRHSRDLRNLQRGSGRFDNNHSRVRRVACLILSHDEELIALSACKIGALSVDKVGWKHHASLHELR